MPLHPSAFAFGLTVIAMLLGGQVFNAQADQESHDVGPEFSANVSATDDEDWKGQSSEESWRAQSPIPARGSNISGLMRLCAPRA